LLSVSKGVSGADVIIDRQRKSLERSVGKWLALQCRGLRRQPAQNLQIDRVHVGAVIRFFRRLQDHGMLVETRIVDEQAEWLKTELAFADVGVPVNPAAQRLEAIVDVKRAQPLQTDNAIEFTDRRLVLGRR